MIIIRRESSRDIEGIHQINEQAFGQSREATIVDKLRAHCNNILSLVALQDDKLVGHVLFTPATIEGPQGRLQGMGLAPMAVLPAHQRQGIGSAMVREGIRLLKDAGCAFIIVLGHPEYYPRFGFIPASRFHIKSQWEGVPNDEFMILWLQALSSHVVSSIAQYRDEFNDAI